MPDPLRETVSATEMTAILGLSPYQTRWLTWRIWRGLDTEDDDTEDERMRFGTLMEPIIFNEALRRLNIEGTYNETQHYIRHADEPIGCTPDGECWHPSKGRAVVECKNVDWIQYKEKWIDGMPPHIMCQVQVQMLVTGAAWGVVAVLVGGNELHLTEILPDKDLHAELIVHARDFMASVKAGDEPDPDGVPLELPTLLQARDPRPDAVADLTTSEEAFDAAQALAYWQPRLTAGNKAVTDAKAKLVAMSGGAGKAICHGYGVSINYSQTKEIAVELPAEITDPIRAALDGDAPMTGHELHDALEAAVEWRHITRRGGVTTRWKTWERDEETAAPWLEGFTGEEFMG